MQAVFVTTRGKTCKRVWALDADLAAAFDRIDHSCLLGLLGTFPARGRVEQWLKAGVLDRGRFAPTEQGCPQGGVISPVLMNVVLHGMEEAAGVRYHPGGHRDAGTAVPGSPVLIRYADDALALCHSREQAEQVKARLAAWLELRGLAFNEAKTAIVHLDDGVDFLGFNVRRYRGKLLIKPGKAAVKRIKARLTTEMKALRGHNAQMVLLRLNPVIRGWSAYYRHCVSSKVFDALDDHMWKLTYKWAMWSHPHKGKRWIVRRYFGRFVPSRRDRWVFGDRDSGAYLFKFAWTKITRHTLVKGWASPDDPALASYWAARRRRGDPPLRRAELRLLKAQQARCAVCGGLLLHADQEPQHPDEWEQWITAVRKAVRRQAITTDAGPGTPDQGTAIRLIHAHCRRRLPDAADGGPALLQS
jgi:RNA-directed DNA polymerase